MINSNLNCLFNVLVDTNVKFIDVSDERTELHKDLNNKIMLSQWMETMNTEHIDSIRFVDNGIDGLPVVERHSLVNLRNIKKIHLLRRCMTTYLYRSSCTSHTIIIIE